MRWHDMQRIDARYVLLYVFLQRWRTLSLVTVQNSIGPAKKISEILLNEERKYIIEVVAVQP